MRAFQKYMKSKQNMPKGTFTSSESEHEIEKDQRRSKRNKRKKIQTSKKIFAFAFAFDRCERALKCRWIGFLAASASGEVMAGACLLRHPTESGVPKG